MLYDVVERSRRDFASAKMTSMNFVDVHFVEINAAKQYWTKWDKPAHENNPP